MIIRCLQYQFPKQCAPVMRPELIEIARVQTIARIVHPNWSPRERSVTAENKIISATGLL